MEPKHKTRTSSHIILDIRSRNEFDLFHEPHAIHCSLIEIPKKIEELKELKQAVFLRCSSGYDCRIAHLYLKQQGIISSYASTSRLELNLSISTATSVN